MGLLNQLQVKVFSLRYRVERLAAWSEGLHLRGKTTPGSRGGSFAPSPQLRILSVARRMVPQGIAPVISVRFTPVEVYEHIGSYDKLQKAMQRALSPFQKSIIDTDVRRVTKSGTFSDKGWDISFRVGTEEQTLHRAEKALRNLVGTKYK